jgi:hypothetical protein
MPPFAADTVLIAFAACPRLPHLCGPSEGFAHPASPEQHQLQHVATSLSRQNVPASVRGLPAGHRNTQHGGKIRGQQPRTSSFETTSAGAAADLAGDLGAFRGEAAAHGHCQL